MTGSDDSSAGPAGEAGPEARTGAAPDRADRPAAEVVARITADDVTPAERRGLVAQLARKVRLRELYRPKTALRWIVDTVAELAPHVPIRDLETLRRHHGGLDGDALAERLIRNAARVAAGIGMSGGGLAAIEWVAPPTLLSAPVLLAVETVAVVAVEIKLLGELHEVYRSPVPGSGAQRAVALLHAWADRRGVNPMVPGSSIAVVLSTAARKQLRERLVRRLGRNLTMFGPLLTGAAVGGYLNQRATKILGEEVRKELAARPPALPPSPQP